MSNVVSMKRPPGSMAERFWSIARASSFGAGPSGDDATNPDPKAVVRHVLKILDALSAGEVGDGVTRNTISFLALLRQQEAAGDMSYASPEQARGETLDERSLVFSVGVLMFEELTGRHPFGAVNNTRRFARIQKGEMGSGVQYFPQVPGQLRSVLMKAMGPFPEERFASMKELRAHLERFQRDEVEEPKRERPQRLKGLPPTPAELMFDTVEEQATTLFRTQPSPETSTRATPSRGVPVRPPSVSRTVEVRPKRAGAILERVAFSLGGAAVAVVATLLLAPRSAPAPAPAPAAAPAPVAAAPKVEPLKTEPVKAEPVKAEPAKAEPPRARTIEPPAVPPVARAEQPGVFDLDLAGQNALAAARPCFGHVDHTVSFGAGLFFAKGDALVHRSFLSPDEPLSPDERKCVKGAFAQVSAGAAPDKGTVAEMRFKVRPGDGSADTYSFKVQ